jgi:hypothetical protein
MIAALSLTNIYSGFSTGNIILESGLRVELGCVLLHETNEVDG